MDTDALALAFPLHSADLPAALPGRSVAAGGVLVGVNPSGSGIVWWDRWRLDNHNSLVLARSGAGKSYLVKLDVLRSLYAGVQVAVIDPEDEYPALAAAVGGTTIALGTPGVRVNPLDLPPATEVTEAEEALTRRALFCHTLGETMVSSWSSPETWQTGGRHPGRGKYLLKTGHRIGMPVEMHLVADEPLLYETDRDTGGLG